MVRDTSPEAAAVQEAIFRRMSTEQRLQVALELSDCMRDVALGGLRSRHPELSERDLLRELIRLMYGVAPRP